MLKALLLSISLLSTSAFANCPEGERLFNGPCVCIDPMIRTQETLLCHNDFYGQRYGTTQAGLCKEACERRSGQDVLRAPPEKR